MKSTLLIFIMLLSGSVFASSDMGQESVDREEMIKDMQEHMDCVVGDENCHSPGVLDSEHGEVIHHDDIELPIEDHMGDH